MTRGIPLTPAEKARIISAYAASDTYQIESTARACGVNKLSARKAVHEFVQTVVRRVTANGHRLHSFFIEDGAL